jgi:competence protein ComEA
MGMNIAKMYKAIAQSFVVMGLAAALALPISVSAAEKPTVDLKSQDVKVAEPKAKGGGGKELAAVNINTADAVSLAAALNGIGIKKAEAIVAYREQKGKFTSAEQLLEVKGIGKATLEKNKDKIKI